MTRVPSGVGTRLFFTCWLVYAVHFATNIVREHYPAFSLAERGTLRVDPYLGLHDDIFEIPGRGAFINNNPGASIIAAIPYALARPGVDAVVRYVNATRARLGETVAPSYNHPRADYREFFTQVHARNLDIRFGLAAGIIHLFCMAPLTAGSAVVMRGILCRMGFGRTASLALALLYAFGTPVFLRTGFLNQNLIVAVLAFFAFALLFRPAPAVPDAKRQVAAGMLMGLTVLCDYSGLVVVAALGGYALWRPCHRVPLVEALRRVGWLMGGAALPIAVLLGYQAWAFGHPLYPAQHYMPASEFSVMGWSGFTGPRLDLLYANLFDATFGLFVFCPLLLLAFAAPGLGRRGRSLVGSPELVLVFAVFFGIWMFCSSTPYAWWQWETGVRYLVPSVPFLFLATASVMMWLPRLLAWVIGLLAVAQSWCLAMVREDVGSSLRVVLLRGPQLPWMTAVGRVEGYDGGTRWDQHVRSHTPAPCGRRGDRASLVTLLVAATAPMSHALARVRRNVGSLGAAHLGCRALHLVLVVAIGRLLGADGLAGYSVAAALGTCFGFLTDIGLSARLARELAARPHAGAREYAQSFGSKMVAAGIVVVALPVLLALLPFQPWVLSLCALMAIAGIVESFTGLNNAVCQAHERMEFEAAGAIVQTCLFVGLSIAALVAGVSPLAIGGAAIVGATAELGVSTLFARRFMRLGRLPPRWATVVAAAPYATNSLAFTTLAQLDVVVLALVASSVQVGEYAAVSRLLLGAAYLPLLAATAIVPTMTSAYVQSDPDGFRRLGTTTLHVGLLLAGAAGTALVCSARWLTISVYGSAFAPLYPLLQLGAVFLILRCLTATLAFTVTASGQQPIRARSAALGLAATGILIPLLSLRFGVAGAVCGLILGEAVALATVARATRPLFSGGLKRTALRTFAAGIAAVLAHQVLDLAGHPWAGLAVPLVVYASLIALCGELTRVWRFTALPPRPTA